MADFSKIGRNNKNRGRTFERKVAEMLRWTRVPYSGAMLEWGGGDVVDGFYVKRGFWSAECKTQPEGASVSIKSKWIQQVQKGETHGRHGIIITKNLKMKVQDSLVFMPEGTWIWLVSKLRSANIEIPVFSSISVKSAGVANGFFVKLNDWTWASKPFGVVFIDVHIVKTLEIERWASMSLLWFKNTIHLLGLMVEDSHENGPVSKARED